MSPRTELTGYVQYITLEYDSCDECGSRGVCYAITTTTGDTVLCIPCAQQRPEVEV